MRTAHVLPMILTTVLLAAGSASAEDIDSGKALLQQNCQHCHNDSVYKRDKKLVKDYSTLLKQVNRCQLSLELQWFDEDITNVSAHLNTTYYHFSKK